MYVPSDSFSGNRPQFSLLVSSDSHKTDARLTGPTCIYEQGRMGWALKQLGFLPYKLCNISALLILILATISWYVPILCQNEALQCLLASHEIKCNNDK